MCPPGVSESEREGKWVGRSKTLHAVGIHAPRTTVPQWLLVGSRFTLVIPKSMRAMQSTPLAKPIALLELCDPALDLMIRLPFTWCQQRKKAGR